MLDRSIYRYETKRDRKEIKMLRLLMFTFLPLFILKKIYPVPKIGEIWKLYNGNLFFEQCKVSYIIIDIRKNQILVRPIGRDNLPFMNDTVEGMRVFMDICKKVGNVQHNDSRN